MQHIAANNIEYAIVLPLMDRRCNDDSNGKHKKTCKHSHRHILFFQYFFSYVMPRGEQLHEEEGYKKNCNSQERIEN